ncbi:MAG: hypothetical protein LBT65_06050 [Synergistaceae bacterium]|jgi:hypothetical protein|nr:hypothetical protein [Synergistaceae bacterium]
MKRVLTAVYLAVYLFSLCAGGAEAAVSFRAFSKETSYPLEDAILKGMEPNVLFFLDTSASMAMSMKGEYPTFVSDDKWMQANMPVMRDATYRAGLLDHHTFGTGARPVSAGTEADQKARRNNNSLTLPFVSPWTGTEKVVRDTFTSASKVEWANRDSQVNAGYSDLSYREPALRGYSRYGRDIDSTNNIIGDPNCYYSPDPAKPYLLTLRDSLYAYWNGKGDDPGMPFTLSQYLPKGILQGVSVSENVTNSYLVPNDSKMYKMKLVLWRLLSPENADMLSRMRIGVATNFSERLWGMMMDSASIKRSPFRSDDYFGTEYYQGGGSAKEREQFRAYHNGVLLKNFISFPHGTGPEGSTGIPYGDYGASEHVFGGVLNDYYSNPDPAYARHVERAIFRVPFDFMYAMNPNGTYKPSSSLIMFRELIDGIEQVDFKKGVKLESRFVNDELFPVGTAELRSSLYGRNGAHVSGGANLPVLGGQKAVSYTLGAEGGRTLHGGIKPANGGVLMSRIRNSEGLMTGTALGSVIDFFSPMNESILNFTRLPQNPTAAQVEQDTRGYFHVTGSCQPNWMIVFTGGNEVDVDASIAALKNLYLNSKTMRGRHWDGSQWIERTYEMDYPIRTVFVGMVPTNGMENDGDPYVINEARTHAGGLRRLRNAIRRMAHAGQPLRDGRPDKSVEPYFADNAPDLIMKLQEILLSINTERFAGGAPVIEAAREGETGGDRALFTSSYEVSMMKQWKGTFSRYRISPRGVNGSSLVWEAGRYMENNARYRAVYTTTGLMETPQISLVNVRDMNNADLAKLTATPAAHAAKFKEWLLTCTDEDGVLGDMEHSGFAIVGKPQLKGIAERPRRIYLQTNRGVLHSLDYENGGEAWAFIPPNIFQHRVRDQKFLNGVTWISRSENSMLRSRPLALLDGMLSARDVRIEGASKTLMLGAMGWGGNGFYAMDVTKASGQPVFLWAIDNARYAGVEPKALDGVKRWGAAAGGSKASEYDYSDLGLTIAAPDLRSTKTADVGILPGGLGYNFGADSHGKAFYIFKPQNGAIIKKLDTRNGYVGPGELGMGITPVTYITRDAKTAEFFTGDSEGNVLFCDTTGHPKDWKLESLFRLRTATDGPVALTKALEVVRVGKTGRWLFGGTSDLMVPDFSDTRKLKNEEQYIFGLNLKKLEEMSSVATTSDLVALKYLKTDPESNPPYGESGDQVKVTEGDYGWFLKLRPKLTHATLPTEAEYVTTSPTLYNGTLYVSTFIPRTRLPNNQEQCMELGDSRMYALDPLTGASKWPDGGQAHLYRNVKIAGISASGGSLFMGIKELKPGALNGLHAYDEVSGGKIHARNTVLEIPIPVEETRGTPQLAPVVPHVQYWREVY